MTVTLVDDHTRRQTFASDPEASAWVSANAGSGKTHVLTQRVKRLLLAGVVPSRILCLTFTKAAAANMANRVLRDLAEWAAAPDGELNAKLAALKGVAPDGIGAADRAAARRVFARALETPGGLKIQTIHAFCDALLHQFPFEAGVAASFQVMDDARAAELQAQARAAVLRRASLNPAGPLGCALARVVEAIAEDGFADLLAEMARSGAKVDATLPTLADMPAFEDRAKAALGCPPGATAAGIEARILGQARLKEADWPAAIAALAATGKATDRKRGELLAVARGATDPAARAAAFRAAFLKQDGDFLQSKSLCTADIRTGAPWLCAALEADLDRLAALDLEAKALRVAERSAALIGLARAVLDHVAAEKTERGLLDFPDLVTRAAALLGGEQSAWVRYKLDRGVDHVLVDEAQDTSPEQWRVVAALTQEFFAGEGAAEANRTLFAVGDDKQSIFSFQGADPAEFDRMRRKTAAEAEAARRLFHDQVLQLSFRSSPPVLDAVDRVFAAERVRDGVSARGEVPPHQSARMSGPGEVVVWPVTPRPDRPEITGWDHHLDEAQADDPRVKLAQRIARTVKGWLDEREPVQEPEGARPMRAGDVMILVRRRNGFFEGLIRALKDEGVPVAGADRLVLVEHIAVMDLMALGDCVLLPDDDLAFATLMKSPLMGLDEDDLYALAHDRRGRLHTALRSRAGENPRWRAASDRFGEWRRRADRMRPYEFYARVLGADGGRRALTERLGREAEDAIDEFLARAMEYDRSHVPSLQGFLAWMRETAVDVKREMDQGRDEVRVMTVHNAKGLEAKVVILPDTTGLPGAGRTARLLDVPDPAGGAPLLLWSPSKGSDVGPLVAARALHERRQLEEYRRLLYVALTRAEQRLLVCGLPDGNRKEPSPESWYAIVGEALSPDWVEETGPDGEPARVWRRVAGLAAPVDAAATAEAPPARPDWADRLPPKPAPARVMVAPSRAGEGAPVKGGSGRGRLEARLRGEALHRLLQVLPDLPEARRAEAAARYLDRRLPGLAENVLPAVEQVLALPELAPFFGPAALAEVPIVGDVVLPDGRKVTVAGQIDRLAITDETIALLDYKSGAAPDAVPEAYVAQLALYAAALRLAFPGREVEAAILWTDVPRLDAVGPGALDDALARIRT